MPVRILTDEDLSPEISHRLTALGFDVTCVRDRGLLGKKDWQLMPWCIEHGYAICTKNGPDFEREHHRCRQRGEHRPGLLAVGEWSRDEMYWALRQYLEENPDGDLLIDRVVRLSKASPEFIRTRR